MVNTGYHLDSAQRMAEFIESMNGNAALVAPTLRQITEAMSPGIRGLYDQNVEGIHAVLVPYVVRRHVTGELSTEQAIDAFEAMKAFSPKLNFNHPGRYGIGILGHLLAKPWAFDHAHRMLERSGYLEESKALAYLDVGPIYQDEHPDAIGLINYFLENGANPDVAFNDGVTPLMLAIRNGFSMEVISSLVSRGADIYAVDANGQSVVEHARTADREYVIEIFERSAQDMGLDFYEEIEKQRGHSWAPVRQPRM